MPVLARKDFARVLERALSDFTVRKAWVFVAGGKCVIRATRRFKETKRHSRGELLVTYGTPNYAETRTLRSLARRGEPVPKHVQTASWPKKAAGKAKA
jgi:hypothetical protein